MSGVSPHCQRVLDNFRKEICWDFKGIRAVVICKAWQFMEEQHIPFKSAVRKAWAWVKDQCAKWGAFI